MKNDEMKENTNKSKAARVRRWAALLLLAACLLLAVCAYVLLRDYVSELKGRAYDVRDDVKALMVCLKEQDADEAEKTADKLASDVFEMEAMLETPIGRLAARSGFVEDELKVIHKSASIVTDGSDSLVRPYIALMREIPLSSLKSDEGFDLALAKRYIAFLQEKSGDLSRLSAELNELGSMPCGRLEKYIAGLRDDIEMLDRIVPLADEAADLLAPTVDFLQEWPLSRLKTGDGGIDLAALEQYLRFANDTVPRARALLEKIDAQGPEQLESSETYRRFREKAASLLELYDETQRYQPLLRAFVGSGEDRLYVFAAQNSSEIRASGGFPGSVGTIRIRDGVLRIEDFKPVNDVLYFYKPHDVLITQEEARIFGDWFFAPRDADFCPDFERVGEIWASAYAVNNGEQVDGVLSATPVIIQRILSVVGPVELSDGTVLDGTNAARILEYDMYYRFFGYGSDTGEGNEISDALFAETAKMVMEKAMGELSLSNARGFLSVLEESAADRTLMLWMKDESEQELVRAAGLACSLNDDPAKPEAGIYFALTNPSRMGWFLNMLPSCELLETHEDGSRTYAVHLDMENVMTEQELLTASWYISGSGNRGTVTGFLYLFAPAGGTISEISGPAGGPPFSPAEYHGLPLEYTHQVFIRPGASVSFDYTVTTAPGEQEDLVFSMTPTLQAYR